MRKLLLSIIVLLPLYVAAGTSKIEAQDVFDRCSRTTIESFPEEQKRPVLQYLDESRQAADKFVRLLAEEKFDEIYKLNKRIKIWVQGQPNTEMDLAAFRQTQGTITNFEYREQDLIWNLFSREIDLRGTVGTWYLVKTTNTANGAAGSLLVETRKGQKEQPVFESIFFDKQAKLPLEQPSDPLPLIQRGNCPAINGNLTVKAP